MNKVTNQTATEKFHQAISKAFSEYNKNELSLRIKAGILAKKSKLRCKSK